MNDAVVAVSIALFIVWEWRFNGWANCWGCLTGKYAMVAPESSKSST